MLPSLRRQLIKLTRSFYILKESLNSDIKLPEKLTCVRNELSGGPKEH